MLADLEVKQDTYYLSNGYGRTGQDRAAHLTKNCPRLRSAKNIYEKPRDVVERMQVTVCEHCLKEVDL